MPFGRRQRDFMEGCEAMRVGVGKVAAVMCLRSGASGPGTLKGGIWTASRYGPPGTAIPPVG